MDDRCTNDDRLLTSDDLAAWLGVPKGTLHQWAYRGVGPRYLRVGRHRRYRRRDVERWLDERERGGGAA